MQSAPFPEGWMDGWIEGRGGEERKGVRLPLPSLSLFLMSAAAAENIRHISGQELRVPFILPSFLPSSSLPLVPPPAGNVLYKARGRLFEC